MGDFRDWITKFRPAFRGLKWRALFGAFADVLGEAASTEATASLVEELPAHATDPTSVALELAERGLEPGPSLSLAAQRAYADAAPALNRFRGRPLGLLTALYYADLGTPYFAQQNGLVMRVTAPPQLGQLRTLTAPPSWLSRWERSHNNPPIPASTDGRPAIPGATVSWFQLDDSPMDSAGNQHNGRFLLIYDADDSPPDFTDPAVLARAKRIIAAWKPAAKKCTGVKVTSGNWWGKPGMLWAVGGPVWANGGGSILYPVE